MVVLHLIQKQTCLFFTQPLTKIDPLKESKTSFLGKKTCFHIQFFNPFIISLGLLNSFVFSFKYIIFSLLFFFFVLPSNLDFQCLVIVAFKFIVLYCMSKFIQKKIYSVSSANLQVIEFSQSI